jgi:hypothetical protein
MAVLRACQEDEHEVVSLQVRSNSPWDRIVPYGYYFLSTRGYYVSLTNKRLLFWNLSRVTGNPTTLDRSFPLDEVVIDEIHVGGVAKWLTFHRKAESPERWYVPSPWRHHLAEFKEAFGR